MEALQAADAEVVLLPGLNPAFLTQKKTLKLGNVTKNNEKSGGREGNSLPCNKKCTLTVAELYCVYPHSATRELVKNGRSFNFVGVD